MSRQTPADGSERQQRSDGRARQIGPDHPEYAAPLPPEARDLPHSGPQQPRKNGSAGAIALLATAALPVLMWLLGRKQRHA